MLYDNLVLRLQFLWRRQRNLLVFLIRGGASILEYVVGALPLTLHLQIV